MHSDRPRPPTIESGTTLSCRRPRGKAERRRSNSAVACALAPAFAASLLLLGCREDRPGSAGQPLSGHNVLLITLDTTRADRIGCYGYAPAATPALDALARRGTLFSRSYAQAPITLPSHCTIMTGRYPKELGVRDNGRAALSAEFETLAEIFKANGYVTGAFIAAFVLDSRFGLDQGFDVYDDVLGPVSVNEPAFSWQRPANEVTDSALAWLEASKNRPFFGWIHYYDPHEPYAPPPPFALAHSHPYEGEIAFMDSQLARILDWLDRHQLADRTLIVVVGDHGESLGEHGVHGHTMFLYENILHVPMMVVHPAAAQAGHRVHQVVETADIFPTVLDLMGLKPSASTRSRSLAVLLRGGAIDPRPAYGESNYAFNAYGWSQQRTLIEDRWKYIASAAPSLFDLQNDPAETVNVIDRHEAIAEQMRKKLMAQYESMPEGKITALAMDAQALKALSSLGYVGGKAEFVDEFLTPGLPEPMAMLPVLADLTQAQLLMTQNRFGEAAPLWEKITATKPRSAEVYAYAGACFLQLGRHAEAETALKQAIEIDPEHATAFHYLGDLYAKSNEIESAISAYEVAASLPVPNPQVFTKLGDLLVQSGRAEEALAKYQQWIKDYPDFPALRARLGALLAAKGDLQPAIEHLESAARLAPSDDWSRKQLALAYYRRGVESAQNREHAAAAANFERVLELDPENPNVVENLAGYYLQTGRTADAVRVLRVGVARGSDPRAMMLLANLLATSKDDSVRNGEEAVQWAERGIDASGTVRAADVAVLAAAFAEAGQFDQAIVKATEALSIADAAGDANLAAVLREQIELYRRNQPFRHPQF